MQPTYVDSIVFTNKNGIHIIKIQIKAKAPRITICALYLPFAPNSKIFRKKSYNKTHEIQGKLREELWVLKNLLIKEEQQ